MSAESAIPVSQIPVTTVVDPQRLPRALAFAAFMALFAASWIALPALASWFVAGHRELPLLSFRVGLFGGQTFGQLLAGGAANGGAVALGIHILLAMSAIGIGGFLYSYRWSASVRRVSALDNGAC